MKKLLGFLTVTNFAVAVGALTLAYMLFQRREILLGRTMKLEQALTRVAATLETSQAAADPPAELPLRDVDAVVDRQIAMPRVEDFWDDYAFELEQFGNGAMDLARRRRELAAYYLIDPITLKAERDALTGVRITTGPGTMQAVLDDVEAHATAQLGRLNATRALLGRARMELVDVTEELNSRRQELRSALCAITDKNAEAARLATVIANRDRTIAEAEARQMRLDMMDRDQALALREERIVGLEEDKRQLLAQVAVLRNLPPDDRQRVWPTFTPGVKGRVRAVNVDRGFVVLQLAPEFVEQYRRAYTVTNTRPEPDLTLVRHHAKTGEVVGKVRLSTVDPASGLASADIMSVWRQADPEVEDTVLY